MGCILGHYACGCCPDGCVTQAELAARLERRRLARLALEEREAAAREVEEGGEHDARIWILVRRLEAKQGRLRRKLLREEHAAAGQWPRLLAAARKGAKACLKAAAASGDAEAVQALLEQLPDVLPPAAPPPPPPQLLPRPDGSAPRPPPDAAPASPSPEPGAERPALHPLLTAPAPPGQLGVVRGAVQRALEQAGPSPSGDEVAALFSAATHGATAALWTPLCHTASRAHGDATRVLLQLGADADWRTRRDRALRGCGGGATPLLLCAAGRNRPADRLATAELLLSQGNADPDAHDADGMTALCLAVRSGQRELAALLLRYGAHPEERGAGGVVAADLAAAAPMSADAVADLQDKLREAAERCAADVDKQLRRQGLPSPPSSAGSRCQCPYDCDAHPAAERARPLSDPLSPVVSLSSAGQWAPRSPWGSP
eukprot:TRINITY_DN7051_c0_g1_i1.p1 TRINITY_DN7051_c0_g1~~TRINITY_DN7051_c0_g1_i1.p1  ORF type:complete len:453 (+),score=170.70 TRINITY_DN7051_c0_g1_i1:69-1361(+)